MIDDPLATNGCEFSHFFPNDLDLCFFDFTSEHFLVFDHDTMPRKCHDDDLNVLSQCSTLVRNTVVRSTFKVNGKPPILGSRSPLTP